MAVRDTADEPLPTSHFFLTLAHGRSTRTFVARAGAIYLTLAFLPILAVWLVGSTVYIGFHDTLVTSLLTRQRDMQYDYEDRIAALRSRIDRDASRRLLDQHALEAKLEELRQRETELQGRAVAINRFDEQATHLMTSDGKPISVGRSPAPAPVADEERHAGLSNGADTSEAVVEHSLVSDENGASIATRLSALSTTFDDISTLQDRQIAAVAGKARGAAERLRTVFDTVGLSPQRFAAAPETARGGPFVPLPEGMSNFDKSSSAAQMALDEASALGAAIKHVPLARPLAGDPDVTSPFGPRTDPFLGRMAMHTGIDLREDTGTEVRTTAPGRVVFAGAASGYGLMVEVDHGSGLSTRYAHLSAVDVAVGKAVALGDIVGRVGATGRATGPHLHYETRIDGEAVDPMRFLAAGRAIFGVADRS